jgi:hypothetical protein
VFADNTEHCYKPHSVPGKIKQPVFVTSIPPVKRKLASKAIGKWQYEYFYHYVIFVINNFP